MKLSLKGLITSFTFYSCSLGLLMSTIFYIASICGIVSMYPLYAHRPLCILNIFFITWTAILLIVMMVVSLHSKVCPSRNSFWSTLQNFPVLLFKAVRSCSGFQIIRPERVLICGWLASCLCFIPWKFGLFFILTTKHSLLSNISWCD